MKLSIICEVFDKLNMDGVDIVSKSGDGAKYSFADSNLQKPINYRVRLFRHYRSPNNDIEDHLASYMDLSYDSIYLETLQHGYGLTDAANQFFVYSKLLACIKDFWVEHGVPTFIEFSGSQSTMNVTYSKLLSRAAKIDPVFHFVPYDTGFYIRANILKSLPEELIGDKLQKAQKKYDDYIDSIKDYKKRKRSYDKGNFY